MGSIRNNLSRSVHGGNDKTEKEDKKAIHADGASGRARWGAVAGASVKCDQDG